MIHHDRGESVQLAAMRELEEGGTVYLAFSSKADANQAFFNVVNTESAKYDYIICTPSVSTGVSIDNNHFDFVGGVFPYHYPPV